jgi:general stress protein YciG
MPKRTFDRLSSEEHRELSRRGGEASPQFSLMSPEDLRDAASEGGKRAHKKGTARKWDSESARDALRKRRPSVRDSRGKFVKSPPAELPSLGDE